MAPKANCTQRRQEVSHNSLGTSYYRIPAKRTGISRKTSAFIEGRIGRYRHVLRGVERGSMGLERLMYPRVMLVGCLTSQQHANVSESDVGCLTSQQRANVSQGQSCSDICTCCHTEIEVADQTFYLTQSQYTDIRPTSPCADPISPGTWQDSH